MEGTRDKLQTGSKDEIQMRRNSSHSNRASPSFQNASSTTSNDDNDLQLFKWAQTTDVRRRSSDAAGHKWLIENMKDGNQSDDDDPLGLLQETNNEEDEDYDDSPISSRPDSKSPQVLFPPDSLWEESRRDSFFEKARRDSIRWVEDNKKEILQEMKNTQDDIDSEPDTPDGIVVPDTPVLKRNSYMEKSPPVHVVVTSYDDEPSDEEVAEPPRSWIASAIRRLSQSVAIEPSEKDLSDLRNRGQVALEVKEIETKRRGSQSLTSDVVSIMAEWEKEHKERRASCIEQDNTNNQNDNSASHDFEGHKGSYNNERRSSGSRKNSYHDGDSIREQIRRDSRTSGRSLRKSISNIDDSEVKVIITSPDDESEIIETPRSWVTNTIRRLSNASSINESHTDDRRSSKENINYKDDSNDGEDYTYSTESTNNSHKVFDNHGINEQNSDYEDDETPKGWLATAIRRLSSVGNDKDSENSMVYMANSHGNLNDEIEASEDNMNRSNKKDSRKSSVQDDYEKTQIDIRRASTGSSRRGSHKDAEKVQSVGKVSAESSRRGSYKSNYDVNNSPADEKPTEWLASAIRRLSTVPTEEDSIISEESSIYERRKSNNNETRRKSAGTKYNIDERRASSESRRYSQDSHKQQSTKTSRSESRNSLDTDEQPDVQNMLSPEDTPTGWLVNAVRRLSSASNEDIINEKRTSIDRRSSNQSSYRNEREEDSRGASRTSFHIDPQDEDKESDDSNAMLLPEDSPSGWLAGAVRRLSSVSTENNMIRERRLSTGSMHSNSEIIGTQKSDRSRNVSRSSLHDEQQDLKNIVSVERRRSSQGSHINENKEGSRSASRSSFHADQQDENKEFINALSPEDTPTGWLVNAVRRLSSALPAEGFNIEEISPSLKEDHYQKTSRSVSKNAIHDEQVTQSMLSPEDTPSGWLASAVRRLSSVSNEHNINMEERRLSTEITNSDSEMHVTPKSQRSRNASRSSIHDEQQNLENTLSPEDTPTGWLVNAVRRLSSVTAIEESSIGEIPPSVQEDHYLKTSRSASKSSIHNEEDSNSMLLSEDTPTGWLAGAVRRLSSVSNEQHTINMEERRLSTGSTHSNSGMYSSQKAHSSRNASKISLNEPEEDFKENLSPEDTPTGWLANTVRRLSAASIENDIKTEERKASTDNTQYLRRRSSQGSHRSRSASRSSINLDEQNDIKTEERKASTDNTQYLRRRSSQGSHRSRSASRSSINLDEQNASKNILSPEDTPSGWLANAVRRLSSVSAVDMNNRREPAPSNEPPPPVPYVSSEEEEEDEKSIVSSTGRKLSSNLRESETPPTEEEIESREESLSISETQQLQPNTNWMNSAIRRLSMREEETIKLPSEIQKSASEINHQNIVKPLTNLDTSEEDYTPVLISKKKIGKGMAWQNGFDWDSLQGPPDVTFCGCGFLGIYMVGVAEVLLEHRPDLLQGRIGGSSVGSLIAACLVTGVPLQKLRKSLLHVADLAQAYTLGPFNPWFALEEPLLQGLLEMMPEDAHIKASGRLFLSLTRLSNLSNEVVSEYPTRDELLRAILCCCWLPGISSFTAPTYLGTSYIDGAFSAVNPWHGLSSNLSVSGYAGSFSICPDDSDLYPYQPQVSALGVAYNMQPKNGTRAVDALLPPPGDALDKYYHNGVYDTHIFLTTLN